MPEPQMQPYTLMKRSGNVAKCHGCDSKFEKNSCVLQWLTGEDQQGSQHKAMEPFGEKLLLLSK